MTTHKKKYIVLFLTNIGKTIAHKTCYLKNMTLADWLNEPNKLMRHYSLFHIERVLKERR